MSLGRRVFVASRVWLLALAALASVVSSAFASGESIAGWGADVNGQLGTRYTTRHEIVPVGAEQLPNVTQLAAGEEFTLALLSDGTVASFGNDLYGQLGSGEMAAPWKKGFSHFLVAGITRGIEVSAARKHAMALVMPGNVETWGNNQYGQLGVGWSGTEKAPGKEGHTVMEEFVPNHVSLPASAASIDAAGASDFAILSNGKIMGWGATNRGQLPFEVGGKAAREAEEAKAQREVKEKGYAEHACVDELHDALECQKTPRAVLPKYSGLVKAITGGEDADYALLANGHVLSWGGNTRGQLGTGGQTTSGGVKPAEVLIRRKSAKAGDAQLVPLSEVVEVQSGSSHAVALLKSGEVVGWGNNEDGELGPTSERGAPCGRQNACDDVATPISVLNATNKGKGNAIKVAQLAAGGQFTVVVTTTHEVYAFGNNSEGTLARGDRGTNSGTPTRVTNIGPAIGVEAGTTHAFALLKVGVEPPPPVFTVEPRAHALALRWTFPNGEYPEKADRLIYGPLEGRRCKTRRERRKYKKRHGEPCPVKSAPVRFKRRGATRSYLLEGLGVVPYEVLLSTPAKKKRFLTATPLP